MKEAGESKKEREREREREKGGGGGGGGGGEFSANLDCILNLLQPFGSNDVNKLLLLNIPLLLVIATNKQFLDNSKVNYLPLNTVNLVNNLLMQILNRG